MLLVKSLLCDLCSALGPYYTMEPSGRFSQIWSHIVRVCTREIGSKENCALITRMFTLIYTTTRVFNCQTYGNHDAHFMMYTKYMSASVESKETITDV